MIERRQHPSKHHGVDRLPDAFFFCHPTERCVMCSSWCNMDVKLGFILYHKIDAFEMWCYRGMLRINCTSHTRNIDVGPTTENCFEGNTYNKQPEGRKDV